MNAPISKRGLAITQTELRSDFALFFEACNNMWDKENNPNGKFPLNMAENNHSWPLMDKKIKEVLATKEIPAWVSNYTGIGGSDIYLEVVADFMSKHLCHCTIDPANLVSSCGATAVMELAALVLCDESDVAIIPAPCYPVYTQDIYNKAKVERYDLITHHSVDELNHNPRLYLSDLQRAKKELDEQGKNIGMLVLTTPDNPTGAFYTEEALTNIADWCIQNEVHLLVNELYGLSMLKIDHPELQANYQNKESFQSFANIMERKDNPYLHMVYGLSKDFGVSGLRVGFFYSKNETVLAAYRNYNAPHMVSNLTQWVISEVFAQEDFISKYIKHNQTQITESYLTVVRKLKELNIPYHHATGSLFVWMELSEILSADTAEAENQLWLDMYNEEGILLTPTNNFGHSKKGQFRLVHPFLSIEAMQEAMNRLERFVVRRRNSQ